jgi:hypothetical protein
MAVMIEGRREPAGRSATHPASASASVRIRTTHIRIRTIHGLTWRDIRKLNDRIYRKHHRRSLKAVLADYNAFHQKMLELIEEVPDRDLVVIGRFAWTGPTWTLSDYIRANTASHYRWACKHIRKCLRG